MIYALYRKFLLLNTNFVSYLFAVFKCESNYVALNKCINATFAGELFKIYRYIHDDIEKAFIN